MRLATLLTTGALAGAAVGTAVAVADDPAPAPVPAPVTTTTTASPSAPPPLPATGVRELARVPDPAGGAPWVVRGFSTTSRGRTSACLQLLRDVDGRLGWLAAGLPFAPASFTFGASPVSCGGTGNGAFRFGPLLQQTAVLGDAATGVTQVERSVVWGRLAPGTPTVQVDGRGTLTPVAGQVVLDVRAGGTLVQQLRGRAGGKSFGNRGGEPPLRGASRPLPGTTRVAVRTPDPTGGPAWGVVAARARDGSTCVSAPGRLVGDQLAVLGPEPGVASLAPFTPTPVCQAGRRPTAADPLRLDVAGFGYPESDPGGAAALRRLPGRTIFLTRSTPAVRTVTITTSRGARTLVPDPRTHVAMDVYDGTFPGERVKATARLAGGRTVTLVQATGG